MTDSERAFLAEHPTIRVAVPIQSFAPYQFIDQNNEIRGSLIELLRALAGSIGFKLEPVFFDSWSETLQGLKDRRADVIANIGYTSERDAYLDYTVGVTPYPAALIGRLNDSASLSNPQLDGLTVAVGKGFVSEQYLSLYYPKAVPLPVASAEDGLQAVRDERADLYFGGVVSAMRVSPSFQLDTVEIKRQVFYGSGWTHLAVRSDWTVLANLLNRMVFGKRDALFKGFADTPGSPEMGTLAPLPLTDSEIEALSPYKKLRVGVVEGRHLLNTLSGGVHSGIASEFTSYVAHRLGVVIEIVPFVNELEMVEGLRSNSIDLIPLLLPTADYLVEFVFSSPYYSMPYLLLGRTDSPLYWGIGSLTHKTLALARNSPLREIISRDYPAIKVLEFDSGEQAIAAVASGRADAAVELKLFANRLINSDFAGKIRVLSTLEDMTGDFSFVTAKRSAALMPVLDRALATVDESQRRRIGARWVAIDLEPVRQLRRYLSIMIPIIIGLTLLAGLVLFWNRRIAAENRRRLEAEQRLVDMTDRLRTGVFQFHRLASGRIKTVFSNKFSRDVSRVKIVQGSEDHRGFFDWISPDDRPRVMTTLDRSFETGEPFRESFRFTYPGGDVGWIIAEASSRCEADGSTVWSGYLFDLTSERQLIERLDKSLATKDEFLAIAGHELRTPIHNMALALATFNPATLDDRNQLALDTANRTVDMLEEMTNDLLDLSRADSQLLELNPKPTDIRQLISTLTETFESSMHEKQLRFSSLVRADVPTHLMVDQTRLRQILYNLLGNALKYTDQGSVALTVSAVGASEAGVTIAPSGAQFSVIRFEVEDSGLGIPAEHLDSIFEPFNTIGPADRRSTGLGLAVVQRIVKAMGGQTQVTSTLGAGSVFQVTLPLRTVSTTQRQASTTKVSSVLSDTAQAPHGLGPVTGKSKDRVLLVDDDRIARVMLMMLLKNHGLDADEAESATEALEKLKQRSFDVVITDYRMPETNGVELARLIRRDASADAPRPILVAITAGAEDAQELGAGVFDAVLPKPVSVKQIVTILASYRPSPKTSADTARD